MAHSHSAHSSVGGHDNHGLGHIVPVPVYLKVFAALVCLTIITVLVARVDFGAMNIIVAMFIASIKATLVALFFMHLKWEDKFTWVFAILPLFLLFLLIGGVFIDNPFRGKVEPLVVNGAVAVESGKAVKVEKAAASHEAAGAEHH